MNFCLNYLLIRPKSTCRQVDGHRLIAYNTSLLKILLPIEPKNDNLLLICCGTMDKTLIRYHTIFAVRFSCDTLNISQ